MSFPYDGSAPTACPQNPYMTVAMANNHSASHTTNPLPPTNTKHETSTKANKTTPKVTTSTTPKQRDTTPSLTSTEEPSSSSWKACSVGSLCVPKDSCPSFLRERRAWSRMGRSSFQAKTALEHLRSAVCHKKTQRVCCRGTEGRVPRDFPGKDS